VAVCTFGPGVGGTDRKADPWNRERELEPRNGAESSRIPPPKGKNTSKSLATDLSYPLRDDDGEEGGGDGVTGLRWAVEE
jgi:hypothetical protein